MNPIELEDLIQFYLYKIQAYITFNNLNDSNVFKIPG